MNSIFILLSTTFIIAFAHALMGPDHYVPFIMLSRARNWSRGRTAFITSLAALMHVASSLIIGWIGILFGAEILKLVGIESLRGEIGAYLLIGLGITYTVYAIHKRHRREIKKEESKTNIKKTTFTWTLFALFILGPCEPLIALMFAATPFGKEVLIAVSIIFALVTIITMNISVILGTSVLEKVFSKISHQTSHIMAGVMITITGVSLFFI